MKYVLYTKSTGEIIGQGVDSNLENIEMLDDDMQGYVIVDEFPDPKQKCVVESEIVNITSELQDEQIVRNHELVQTALRTRRNAMLSQSDWTQLADVSINNKSAWDTYRQALRDLPEAYSSITSLDEVEWPQPPQ